MKNIKNLDTKEIIKYILNFDYPIPEYYDENPENGMFFKELIKESYKLRPSAGSFLDNEFFDVAIRIIASQFLMDDFHGYAETSIIEDKLNRKLEDINASDLIKFTNYLGLLEDLKWSTAKEYFYKSNDNSIEIFDFSTISSIVEKYIIAIIDKYLLQLKMYFKYAYGKDFWYKLYQINKSEFGEDDDYTYELERIDSIVNSLLW